MKFSKVARVCDELEGVSSTKKMQEILCAFFKKVPKKQVSDVTYALLGQIGGKFGTEPIGLAEKMVKKTIAQAFDTSESRVQKMFRKEGDLGCVAETFASRSKSSLSVQDVLDTLRKIADTSGKGSQDTMLKLLADLLNKCTPIEARYVVRTVLGQLRLGAGEKTIMVGLACAYGMNKSVIESAYHKLPDLGALAGRIARNQGQTELDVSLALFTPVQMMLAQHVKKLEDIEKKLGFPVAAEYKYDGERVQVHKKGSQVELFSRRLENITKQYPDIVAAIKKAVRAKQCIIEGEIVPVDKKGGLLSFQKLMQRKRKHDVAAYVKKVPVRLFLFELIMHAGKVFMDEPYQKRYEKLKDSVRSNTVVGLADRVVCDSLECVNKMFEKCVEQGAEGVMLKSLRDDSTYEAGLRGWHWVKWKAEYAEGLRDTFDLVVIGAFQGRGKRAGGYGALLCAAYNEKNDVFESFCKVGSGFTDDVLKKMPKKFKKFEVKKKPARVKVKKQMTPDVWFAPKIVVEVAGADITKSPAHMVGKKNLALRFPRFLRYRDKKPGQATTVEEIERMI